MAVLDWLHTLTRRFSRHPSVFRLPEEILLMIFEEGHALTRDNGCGMGRFEMVVSHVCRYWRQLVLDNLSFWSTVVISLPGPLDIVESYMQRSQPLLLDLFIHIEAPFEDDLHFDVLDTINPHVSRWRQLGIRSPHPSPEPGMAYDILDGLPPAAPNLSALYIFLHQPTGNRPPPRTIFAEGAPALSRVWLHGVTAGTCLAPLGSVTDLQFRLCSMDFTRRLNFRQFCTLTYGLPLLTRLVIEGDIVEEGGWAVSELVIVLPALRTLCLQRLLANRELVWGCLIKISAPALQTLVLDSFDDEDLAPFFDHLRASQITNIFPSLRCLLIKRFNHPMSPSTWRDLADAFPSVRHLLLNEWSTSCLLPTLSDGVIGRWPHVDCLTLYSQGMDIIEYRRTIRHLGALIHQRRAGGSPIRTLRLQLPPLDMFMNSRLLDTELVVQMVPTLRPEDGNIWSGQGRAWWVEDLELLDAGYT